MHLYAPRVCVLYVCVCVLYMCVHVCVCVPYVCRYLERPEGGIGSIGSEVPGGSELPDMLGTELKSSVRAVAARYLSNP